MGRLSPVNEIYWLPPTSKKINTLFKNQFSMRRDWDLGVVNKVCLISIAMVSKYGPSTTWIKCVAYMQPVADTLPDI